MGSIGLCRDHAHLLACLVIPSVAVCRFSNTGDEWYVLVGVAKDLILNPRSVAGGFVYTYKLVNSGEKLEFLHKVRGMRRPVGVTGSFTGSIGIAVISLAILQHSVNPGQDLVMLMEAASENISCLLQNHLGHLLQGRGLNADLLRVPVLCLGYSLTYLIG